MASEMDGMAYLETISGERGIKMKKVSILLCLMIIMVVSSVAFAATPFSDVTIEYNEDSNELRVSGSTEYDAIAVFVYAPDKTLKVFKTEFVEDGNFMTFFEKINADQNGEYVVRLANYYVNAILT